MVPTGLSPASVLQVTHRKRGKEKSQFHLGHSNKAMGEGQIYKNGRGKKLLYYITSSVSQF